MRTILKLAVVAAGGIALSAAAAMVCALVLPWDRACLLGWDGGLTDDVLMVGMLTPRPGEERSGRVMEHSLVGCTYLDVSVVAHHELHFARDSADLHDLGSTSHCDAGWPWRCVHGVVQTDELSLKGGRWAFWQQGVWLPRTTGPLLEFRILWMGAAADVLVFGTALWGIGAGCSWARRSRRIRRGLCAACGYDRRGLAGPMACPECGTVPPAARCTPA
jgi:hypothetical protein